MKGVVFGLLLTNALLASWYTLLDPVQELSGIADRPQSGSAIASAANLALLSETSEEFLQHFAGVLEPPLILEAVPEESAAAQSGYCIEMGPFESADLAQEVMDVFEPEVSMLLESRPVSRAIDYRVYLPPLESRDAAAEVMQQLRSEFAQNGIAIDTFLIARGELLNGIALGLFSEQRNASNVREQMRTLGYEVVVREEPRFEERFWLLSEQFDSKEDFDLYMSRLNGLAASVVVSEKLCQTIAQDTQFP